MGWATTSRPLPGPSAVGPPGSPPSTPLGDARSLNARLRGGAGGSATTRRRRRGREASASEAERERDSATRGVLAQSAPSTSDLGELVKLMRQQLSSLQAE
eukprot:15463137-Alexandrium_andersonii.AAC.1